VLVDARVGVLVATNDGSGSRIRLCRSWMPSEAMDEDNTARSQNTLRLRGEEWVGVVLQIALVPTSAVACGEQNGLYSVDFRHNRRRKNIGALCGSNNSALRAAT
jgi:hypothetical protein